MIKFDIFLEMMFDNGDSPVIGQLVHDQELGFRVVDTESGGYISDCPIAIELADIRDRCHSCGEPFYTYDGCFYCT